MSSRIVAQIALLLVALFAPAHLGAEEWYVPGDYDTIQEAIDDAVDGDEIYVAGGSYSENLDFLGKVLLLASDDGAKDTIIDGSDTTLGDGDGATINIVDSGHTDTCVISGFTLIGGKGTRAEAASGAEVGMGGNIFIEGSKVNVVDCVLDGDGLRAAFGGSIFCRDGDLTVENTVIQDNSAGAVRARDATVHLEGCDFLDTESVALFFLDTEAVVIDCVIEGNGGIVQGAMYSYRGTFSIRDSVVSSNQGGFGTGGFYFAGGHDAEITITDCIFEDNTTNSSFSSGAIDAGVLGAVI